ncbi:bifunctional diguanylate cyclase/phosphodiesterase [Alishewanella tabrizica]|uniref:Uncharacterized protein n=1 Tax=Alishewanella tabrizica TaxID=671278 RepID=A0ABQ2WF02_9ALTE|nr:EAL domain-containing protein [Alishewanella tabrizica]GGW51914.1 hypothetical protein GCM10008111_04770 [Alishewanella tabrizica]
MSAPDFADDEIGRLEALHRLSLLDTPAEERFDRITRLAAKLFNVETCLISLVDSDRQWFKSKVGLDACETSRAISFCGHAILQSDIFIVPDASLDERFRANPLVLGAPNIRFYAGAPLCESNRHPIGTLCLIDSAPREFSKGEQQILRDLADIIEHEIKRLDDAMLKKQLVINAARTESVFSTLPDIVFVIDREFRFLVCNEHPDLLKPKHDLIGRSVYDVLPKVLADELVQNVKRAFDSQTVVHHNYTFKEYDKSFEARYRKIDDSEVLVVIRNTTEQMKANEELIRLSEVVRQTTNGIVITDPNGLVVWINEAFTNISGYSIEDMVGRKPGHLLQGADTNPETVKIMAEALAEQKSFTVDVLNYSKANTPFWIRIACNPLLNATGELSGYLAIETNITKEKRDEELIRESKNLLKAVIDANNIGTWHLNIQTGELFINDKWAALLGYDIRELSPINRETWERLTHPEDLKYCFAQIEQHTKGLLPIYEANMRMKHKRGDWIWINTRGRVSSRTADGRAEWMLGTHFDINDQIKAESSLDEKSQQMQAIVESMLDGVISIDSHGLILTFNQAAEEIFGYRGEEILKQNINILMGSPHREHHNNYLSNYINRGISDVTGRVRELDALHKNGHTFPIELSVVAVKMAGETSFIGIVRDITLRKKREQEIHQLAFYDSLTQLPNRRLLLNKLQSVIDHSARDNKYAALFFLDLDNFKNLNDSSGHDTGDLLLCQVAKRLVESVRQGDTVARLGGDEFVIVVTDLSPNQQTAANQAETLAQKIISNLTREYNLEGVIYNTTASIGVTMLNGAETSKEELLKQADMAMYKAKEAGRNNAQFFDPQMQIAVSIRAALVNDLYEALQQENFRLVFQKQVDQFGHVVGVEVLLRWHHDVKGIISPADFIPLAEETGLIVPIGHWVLTEACKTLYLWSKDEQLMTLSIAVNISVVQFSKKDFVSSIINILQQTGADPKRLKLEITETLLASNVPDVKAKMLELQSLGITFSIDDFGTGYSSLSYLKSLPINQLKIDQSFVRDVLNSQNDHAIAQAVITLASAMNLDVIAEGVETLAQRDLLQRMGCSVYQGYLFGKPCSIDALVI